MKIVAMERLGGRTHIASKNNTRLGTLVYDSEWQVIWVTRQRDGLDAKCYSEEQAFDFLNG